MLSDPIVAGVLIYLAIACGAFIIAMVARKLL